MSMIRWGVTSRSLSRWAARARLGYRRTITGATGATALVLLVLGVGEHSAHAQHLWMAAALPFALFAAGWQVWRAPEEGLPDALRWRSRSRRIALRASSIPAFCASLGLVVHLAGHGALAHEAGVDALWAVALAPVPVLMEAALWRLAPRELRRRIRTGQLAEAVRELNTKVPQASLLDFDPDSGYAGTPVPRHSVDSPQHFGTPCEVRPTAQRTSAMLGMAPLGHARQMWLREASLHWDGTTLTLTDGRRTVVAITLAPTDRPVRDPWPDRPVELVLLREKGLGEPRWEARILLLDATGRRLLTMPGLGFLDNQVSHVATAAGLRFTFQYWAPASFELPWCSLWARAYPRHRHHIRLRLGHRL
ncbi:hypothetical protein [Streptacidiphilus sp. EB129]|uniref:hypothetical protein n=1 Tax=Streptacidiphilus sp. EB129 TaxID=3156262 RepID=UPI0035178C74